MIDMTHQVLYSTTTSQVLQWQDTKQFNYAAPPSGTETLTITAEEWTNQSGAWYVVNGALTQTNPYAPTEAQILANARAGQKAIIKKSFTAAANANVTDANGVIWEGGFSSGNSIFLACQLAQQTNQSNITLYDASKTPHTMTVAEGMVAAALIGEAYQKALGTKNSLYANIDAASTVSAVQKVTWPG